MNTIQTLIDACALGAVYALMAVGIGLVFGVLRLVNFAYGQLVMAGAYALAYSSVWGWPTRRQSSSRPRSSWPSADRSSSACADSLWKRRRSQGWS